MNLILILNTIFLIFVSLSCLISITVLILTFISLRPTKSNVSVLLTCNTYLTIIVFCFTLFDIGGHHLHGYLNTSVSFSDRWCEIRAYFFHVCLCAFYYSFVLQAIFRLFRVVFYRKKILQSFGVFIIAIIIQWLFSFVFILFHLLLNDFQYLPLEYNCSISFTNIRGLLLGTLIIYGGPLSIIFLIYAFIHWHIRRSNDIQPRRQKANKRDMYIMKRLIILLIILLMICVPTLTVFVIYIITHYLTPWAYQIQSLNISTGILITSIMLVFITPKMRNIFKQNRQVSPMVTTRNNQ